MSEFQHIGRGIARIPVIPMRSTWSHQSEMVSQLLFGESYSVITYSADSKWLKILTTYDQYEGWIQREQHHEINEAYFEQIGNTEYKISTDVSATILFNRHFMNIVMGSILPISVNELFKMEEQLAFNGEAKSLGLRSSWDQIKQFAIKYMYTPYVWGGKSPFGIDCSGFTQMVFRMGGYFISRDSTQQAKEGLAVEFDDVRPGDLAFFYQADEQIDHVGIVLEDQKIIHASGEVRVDLLSEEGIVIEETSEKSHSLSMIRRILH